jgi:hypothetical protein
MLGQLDMLGLMAPPMRFEAIERIVVDHANRDGWETYKATETEELARTTVERIKWGKGDDRGGRDGPFYALTLWHGDRGWRTKESYALGTGGGGGPYGYEVYETRAAAMLAAFRRKMKTLAMTMAGCWGDGDGTKRQAEDLARWMISQCPPLHFGGINLAEEWAAALEVEKAREQRRTSAYRAAHELSGRAEAILKEAGMWAYSGGSVGGLLKNCEGENFPGWGEDREGHARAWPAEWSLAGHAPAALSIVIYPREGQTGSATVTKAVELLRAGLDIPVEVAAEDHGYPHEKWAWE